MEKPVLKVANLDGNIFAVMGAAAKALKRNGQGDKVDEMIQRVTSSDNYHAALAVIMDYVDFE
jgi:hypothetical protein